jgi:hypothetical protein
MIRFARSVLAALPPAVNTAGPRPVVGELSHETLCQAC